MVIFLKAVEWTFLKEPLRRYIPPEGEGEVDIPRETLSERPLTLKNVLVDANSLLGNQRGYGWSWSRNPFPRMRSPPPTVLSQLRALLLKIITFDTAHYTIQYLAPTVNVPGGDTIFDPSFPPLTRHLRAAIITALGGLVVYAAVDVLYLAGAIFSEIFLGHSVAQWPPLSNRPWLSTSIADFWGRRWHQFFRHIFVTVGAKPLQLVFGRPGAVLGGFLVSAVIHDWGMWGLGRGTEFRHAGGFFLLMGVGVLLERLWEVSSGRKVRGIGGWVWTMSWTVFWGRYMVDAWARRGLVASDFISEPYRPGKAIVGFLLHLAGKLS